MRAGIVGPGGIGRLHARSLRRIGVPLTGVVASSLDSAHAHAERLSARAFASVAEMVSSGEVDVVHVCTPNREHLQAAETALEGGCHVVCEKPLTIAVDEAAALVAGARRRGVFGATCYHYRYFEGVEELRRRVASGAFGDVRLASGRYLSPELRELAHDHWLYEVPGVSLADVGVHWLDLIEHVLRARAIGVLALPSRTFAHGLTVVLELEVGASASCAISQACGGLDGDELSLELHGSTGSARWSLNQAGETLELSTPADDTRMSYAESFAGGTEHAFARLFEQIYGRIPGAPDFADGLHGVALVDAAIRSVEEGRLVAPVDEFLEV